MMWSRILAVLHRRRRHAVDRLRRVRPHRGPGEQATQAAARSAPSAAALPRRRDRRPASRCMRARIVLSGRTEADNRASAVARTDRLHRRAEGPPRRSVVKEGDVVAVLSDEAREAQVAEAEAMVAQAPDRSRGQAAADQARHHRRPTRRTSSRPTCAPPRRRSPGQGRARARPGPRADLRRRQRRAGRRPARRCSRTPPSPRSSRSIPMLAVVEVAERQLGGIQRRRPRHRSSSSPAQTAEGDVRFISPTASEGTRTYRVDVELDNSRRRDPRRRHRRGRAQARAGRRPCACRAPP